MIAKELREIVANDINDVEVQNRLTALAAEADRLAETTVTGLEPEQEIRARAALAAATALGPAISVAAAGPFDPDNNGAAREMLVGLTQMFVELIRDGSQS